MFETSVSMAGMGTGGRDRRHLARCFRRRALGAGLMSLLAASALAATPLVKFSIPAQPLASGLLQLGLQAHISVVAAQGLIAGKRGAQVEGQMDAHAALATILRRSGLTFVFVTPTAARILRRGRFAALQRVRARYLAPPREPTVLAEVMVTAMRRPQPQQDVPVDLTTVTGIDMAAKGLYDIQDISTQLPGVDFHPNTDQKDRVIFIRGVGTITTSQSPEPSVAVVVDGVVMGRSGQSMLDIPDMDRMQVLEGPQGTLFGKNATAGVIDITTNDPTPTPTGYLDAEYYQGGEYRLDGAVSGPIAHDVEGRIALFGGGYDGNVENIYDHHRVDGYRHRGGRAKLLVTPTPHLALTLEADFTYSIEDDWSGPYVSTSQVLYCPGFLSHSPPPRGCTPGESTTNPLLAPLLTSLGIHPSPDDTAVSSRYDDTAYDNNGGLSLRTAWKFGAGYTLTSISAWRIWRNQLPLYDFSQLPVSSAIVPQITDSGRIAYNQVSQELRLVSPSGHFIDYVAGLYFMRGIDREFYSRQAVFLAAPALLPPQYGANHFGSSDTNAAGYGEMDLDLTKRLRAIVGARAIFDRVAYHTDRASDVTPTTAVLGIEPSFADSGGVSDTGWAGRTGLRYAWSPRVMTYATVSRGYTGPAYNVYFNMSQISTPPLAPETSTDYEAGLRAQLFGRRLQYDLSGFLTDFRNYQANTAELIGGAVVDNLIDAGSATTRGIEMQLAARPAPGLTYDLSGLYDAAYVQDFPCAPGSPAYCYIDGQPLPFAPRWKAHLEQDYRRPLSTSLDLDVDTDYRWQSAVQYNLDQPPDTIQPGYGIWNSSLGVLDRREGWTVRLLVKNILDRHYSSYLTFGDLAGLTRLVPRDDDRYFGIDLRWEFH